MSTSCPHDVETVPIGPPLRCHAVGQTPTYDQLRGERINADVPASEPELSPLERPGKHRLRDGMPAAAGEPSPGLEEGSVVSWSGFNTGHSDPPGKHRLRDDTPAAAATSGSSPRPGPKPGGELTESWSWFGVAESGHAGPSTLTRPNHPPVGTPQRGHRPSAGQQANTGRRETTSYAYFPPPAHARGRQ